MEIRTWHARHNKNITLKQLQDLTGITKTALNEIENGKKSPTLDQLEKIAKTLNGGITDLFISKYK